MVISPVKEAEKIERALVLQERNELQDNFVLYAKRYYSLVAKMPSLQNLEHRVNRVCLEIFQKALRCNDADTVMHILQCKNLTSTPLPNGEMPLSYAIRSGSSEVVKRIVRNFPINLSLLDHQKLSILDHALLQNDPEMLSLVLEVYLGKSIPASALTNFSNLNEAQAIEKEIEYYRFFPLVKKLPPLCAAAFRGNIAEINALIKEHKEILNQGDGGQGRPGMTPLDYAVLGGRDQVVQRLLELGAKPGNSSKKNILHLAAISNNEKMLKLVLDHIDHSQINAMDEQDRTPLHYAIVCQNRSLARFLIQKGADLVPKNTRMTPIGVMLSLAKSQMRDPLKLDKWVLGTSASFAASKVLGLAGTGFSSDRLKFIGKAANSLPAITTCVLHRTGVTNIIISIAVSILSQIAPPGGALLLHANQTYNMAQSIVQGLQTCWKNRHLEILRPLRNSLIHLFNGVWSGWNVFSSITDTMRFKSAWDRFDAVFEYPKQSPHSQSIIWQNFLENWDTSDKNWNLFMSAWNEFKSNSQFLSQEKEVKSVLIAKFFTEFFKASVISRDCPSISQICNTENLDTKDNLKQDNLKSVRACILDKNLTTECPEHVLAIAGAKSNDAVKKNLRKLQQAFHTDKCELDVCEEVIQKINDASQNWNKWVQWGIVT